MFRHLSHSENTIPPRKFPNNYDYEESMELWRILRVTLHIIGHQ